MGLIPLPDQKTGFRRYQRCSYYRSLIDRPPVSVNTGVLAGHENHKTKRYNYRTVKVVTIHFARFRQWAPELRRSCWARVRETSQTPTSAIHCRCCCVVETLGRVSHLIGRHIVMPEYQKVPAPIPRFFGRVCFVRGREATAAVFMLWFSLLSHVQSAG